MKTLNIVFLIIEVVLILAIGGYFGIKYYLSAQAGPEYLFMHPTIAKIFGLTPSGIFYKNSEYGFKMIFPETWKGFKVQEKTWQGWAIDGSGKKYSGPEIVIKNPQTTATQQYQDIPIMIFTHEQWGPESSTDLVGANERPAGFSVPAAV